MPKTTLAFAAMLLFFCACKDKMLPGCETNLAVPTLVWRTGIFDPGNFVLPPFVYGNTIGYANGFGNTDLWIVLGADGRDSSSSNWAEPRVIGTTWLEGDYLYWAVNGGLYRRHLPSGTVDFLGSVAAAAGSGGYNEGDVTPFEGLVAGYFREKSMQDRDRVIAVFDISSQQELFRYQVDDSQVATNLGDPVLGRSTTGDTVLAFVENTRSKLLLFNLSHHDSVEVALTADQYYQPATRNIAFRDGHVFLCLKNSVYCYDAVTGALIWKREDPTTSGIIGWLRFENGHLLLNTEVKHLYSLDPATGKILWENDSAGASGSSPYVWNNTLYYVDQSVGDPVLMGVDLETGCTTMRYTDLIHGSGGLIGVTVQGYLIFATFNELAAYQP
ncbi:MAG: PQQ-binding-like beta-propeller repeat protein [Saprospiraceae bacterium]